jgi:hypothetical protein
MQISAETLYERAGILDPSEEPRSGVVDAVSSDPYLTTEQKQTLLSVYRSFVGENADSTPS